MTAPDTLDRLTAVALLGRVGDTGAFDLPASLSMIAKGRSGPEWLLATAASLAQYTQAGVVPHDIDDRGLEPCPEESHPAATGVEAAIVRRVFNQDSTLIAECLSLLSRRGKVPPRSLIPDLLDHARRHVDDRAVILEAVGERGAWLASLNRDWSFARGESVNAAPVDAETTWETGTRDERVAVLRAVRAADPARAVTLIESTWGEDAHDDRAAFVECLRLNLSSSDEPFLERTLDDTRKPVRTAGAELLSRLPESAFVARMTERARACVTIAHKRKSVLEVDPPEATDKPMRRDGLEARQSQGMGARAALLHRILSYTPPSIWGDNPEAVIEAARSTDWHRPLLLGWLAAAHRFRDAEWALALLKTVRKKDLPDDEIQILGNLVDCVRLDDAKHLATLIERTSKDASLFARVVQSVPTPWSEAFSAAAVNASIRFIKAAGPFELVYYAAAPARQVVDQTTRRAHPSRLADLRASLESTKTPEHEKLVANWIATIELRQAIIETLT